MRKKLIRVMAIVNILILCFAVNVTCTATVDAEDVIVSLELDNPLMKINGETAEIDEGRGTKPVVAHGRTLVPIRAIIEAFGGSVGWDEASRTVLLSMGEDEIRLVIDSYTAYLNSTPETLDVAPTVINGRTMLPIRFVAEGFNLGVAWDSEIKTVSVIRSSFDSEEYSYLMSVLPEYDGQSYTYINNNIPFFEDYELISGSFEYYSRLDELGRCDVCFASVARDMMPTEERESISSVTPTGWENEEYDNISGGYLYNRCHLIGFQLTGENANEKNLITGTRYLNIEGMLPFENQIADYVTKTGNHVVYRVTPVFKGSNLLSDGVLLEACSVGDGGEDLRFCVYCYNVQPGIEIDYATGVSRYGGNVNNETVTPPAVEHSKIYRTPTGKKYHLDAECGGKNSFEVTLEEALSAGLAPCAKCAE